MLCGAVRSILCYNCRYFKYIVLYGMVLLHCHDQIVSYTEINTHRIDGTVKSPFGLVVRRKLTTVLFTNYNMIKFLVFLTTSPYCCMVRWNYYRKVYLVLKRVVYWVFFVWCPCMAINVSVQYNGGLLPDIILLSQCYYHRGTRLNAMKRFCLCSL